MRSREFFALSSWSETFYIARAKTSERNHKCRSSLWVSRTDKVFCNFLKFCIFLEIVYFHKALFLKNTWIYMWLYRFTTPELIRKKYPLLGRQEEIKIFQQMLSNLITRFTVDVTTQHLQLEHNMLIIKWAI